MGKLPTRTISRVLIIAFLLLMACMFTGCKTVKKLFEKKKESVSLIEKKDVQFDEKIQTSLDVIRLDKSESYSFVPVDPGKKSTVIHGKDTLNFTNARIEVNKKDVVTETRDNSVSTTSNSDHSKTQLDKKSKIVKRDVEKTGTSPALIWGFLILLLIAAAVWYFKKQIPFL